MLPRLVIFPKTAHILIKMEMNWGTASKFSQLSGYANEIENEAAGSPSGKSRSRERRSTVEGDVSRALSY